MQPEEPNKYVKELTQEKYKYGFTTEVHTDIIERGLNEDVIRLISSKKDEPEWLLEFRLKAYRHWLTLEMPTWAHLRIPEIDYQAISYYADPTKKKEGPKSMDEVDPELIKTFNKLGIPLEEQMALSGMAVDAVMDSVSVKTTFKETLMEKGIIFCSFSEAVREHPDLVKKYLGSVVGYRDNFFAALNSAVFSDGSFVYIPKGVRCPMELSTYFRINARNTGQFERTLIVADDDSYVSYLEGCTAPMRDENQLHAAIGESIVHDRAEVKYSTVQNWYPGDAEGKGGVYNFVTKRGNCKGVDSKLSWTQVETGSAITWKYPSCILTGDNSTAEFYSVAVTNNYQQADTGTKMIHLGKNTRSTIVSKGISAGHSENSYRGLVRVAEKADNARNYSQCDSLLLGDKCGAHTFPYMDIHNETAVVEHEATTSKISEDQIFYCNQRGIPTEDAIGLIVNGYAKEVLNKLPDLACGMIGAMILWPVLKKFKMSGYVDKRANSQVANACLEFMIIGSIASIQLSTVKTYIVPILILSVVMFALTVFYCLVVIRRVCKDDWFEKAMAAYGQNTGSSASAFTLVKMLDPDMKSTTLEEFGIYCGTLAPFTNFFMTLFPTIIVATGSIMIPSVAGAAIFVPALLLFFMSFRK